MACAEPVGGYVGHCLARMKMTEAREFAVFCDQHFTVEFLGIYGIYACHD